MSDVNYQDPDVVAWQNAVDPASGVPRIAVTPQQASLTPSDGGTSVRSLIGAQPMLPNAVQQLTQAPPPSRGLFDKLLGLSGPRYETWPERLARSALLLPGEVYQTGQVTTHDPYGNVVSSQPEIDPNTGHASEAAIQRVQDLSALAGVGSIPAAAAREGASLGMVGGKAIQPELPEGGAFHSAVEHALANAPQDKMSADQWAGWLKNQPGVKQEELDWLNFPAGKQSMTKADMLMHAEGHGVGLQEVEKSGVPLHEDSIGEEADRIYGQWGPSTAVGIEPRDDGMFHAVDHNGNIVGVSNTPQEASKIAEDFRRAVQKQDPDELFDWSHESAEHNLRHYAGGAPKFSEYQLPGGDNYRELLLTMPPKPQGPDVSHLTIEPVGPHQGQNAYRIVDNSQSAEVDRFPTREEAEAEIQRIAGDTEDRYHRDAGVYKSSHWDEPNVLVHMRMNDREIPQEPLRPQPTDAQVEQWARDSNAATGGTPFDRLTPEQQDAWKARGRDYLSREQKQPPLKSLHLEELQSDWHQQGRKQGYQRTTPPTQQEIEAKAADFWNNTARQSDEPTFDKLDRTRRDEYIRAAQQQLMQEGVPDAPFKTTWADLGLKRVIAKAAREGYDAVSWTPGEQQAERYDLSKHLDKVEYSPTTHHLLGHKNDTVPLQKLNVPPEQLADYVGKDVAQKLLDSPTRSVIGGDYHVLSGVDLKVGGEGMKKFYDKMLVDKANAIGKKFGAKVEYKGLPGHSYEVQPSSRGGYAALADAPNGESAHLGLFDTQDAANAAIAAHKNENPATRIPVLRLTPKLKDAAQRKGFPLFMHGSPFMYTPVNGNPFQGQEQK